MKQKTTLVTIRMTHEERAAWKSFAKARGRKLGAIIKDYVRSAMARDERKREKEDAIQ